uniref:hypothetical protein n=1 Tax=Parerythrobacter lutipelagi TaxID=1964208 RepID=UPI0010F5D55D|nr:hypothetical protein [Parerythrobacter lutipelagi]
MSKALDRQLVQDRALRDAALELVKADVSHLRMDMNAAGLASRFATRMSEGATDLYEEAVEKADDNRGVLAALIAAVVLWFARNPLLSLLPDMDDDPAADDEQSGEWEYEDTEDYDPELDEPDA